MYAVILIVVLANSSLHVNNFAGGRLREKFIIVTIISQINRPHIPAFETPRFMAHRQTWTAQVRHIIMHNR